MVEAGNAPVSAPGARQAMEFVRETHKFALYTDALQGHEDLLPLFDGAAPTMPT